MRDILPDLEKWSGEKEAIAVATVISTWGSSPRRVGARMVMTSSGKISGSVSGGCVEAAVFEAGMEVIKTGKAQRLRFQVGDENAWEVGLACGGALEVLVTVFSVPAFETLAKSMTRMQAVCDVLVAGGSERSLGEEMIFSPEGLVFGSPRSELLQAAERVAAEAFSLRHPLRRAIDTASGAVEMFADPILPPPTLVMVGGVHVARALSELAELTGYRTILIDPRSIFGNSERFPKVSRLLQSWPEEAFAQVDLSGDVAVCMLTHDPKIDDPALRIALVSQAFYVGALGGRKTQAERRERLLQMGLTAEQVGRLHGPIGLDIGAETPEEIALSIMAEVVAARRQHMRAAEQAAIAVQVGKA